MTTGAPPPNYFFMSSKRIAPSYHVGPRTYSENGYVPHPLQVFGRVGGGGSGVNSAGYVDHFPVNDAGSHASYQPPAAGITGLGVGGPAMNAGGGEHFYAINGKPPARY